VIGEWGHWGTGEMEHWGNGVMGYWRNPNTPNPHNLLFPKAVFSNVKFIFENYLTDNMPLFLTGED